MPNKRRIRTGTWVRVEIPDQGVYIVYTYLDHTAGFSAQGSLLVNGQLDGSRTIIRLPLDENVTWQELTPAEIQQYHLEPNPGWIAEHYGEQPPPGTDWGKWQLHPKLQGKFHPDYPDDTQVLVHDGGIRFTDLKPELVWVRTVGMAGDVFTGQVLNQPNRLRNVRQGQTITFIVPDVGPHPILVSDQYLAERAEWKISPCQSCGFPELFDIPSELYKKVFPQFQREMQGSTEELMAFTAFCSLCGGVHIVERKGATDRSTIMPAFLETRKKPWWKFWD
jgi:hypothetical protein